MVDRMVGNQSNAERFVHQKLRAYDDPNKVPRCSTVDSEIPQPVSRTSTFSVLNWD